MNNTPRIDAIAHRGLGNVAYIAEMTSLGRDLERELAEKTESLAFQTQLNREVIEREKQTHADLAAEREQVAILRSDEKRLVAFAKTYRMNAEILSDKLAAERALADRLLAITEKAVSDHEGTLHCNEDCKCSGRRIVNDNEEALASWKEARK